MDARTRRGEPGDMDGIWEVFRLGFGATEAQRERWVGRLDPTRCRVVDGNHGEVAAASHIVAFEQFFGGRAVPLAGYSPVAVLPEHRGRGLARAVVVEQYPELRERGEVIAGLFPSSVALYRSVGFELAGSYVQRRVPAAALAGIVDPDPAPVRRGGVGDLAALRRCYERAARSTDGAVTRSPSWWSQRLPDDLEGIELYVVDDPTAPGELTGYAAYRMTRARPPHEYRVVVSEVQATEPAARRALWRVVGSSGTQAPDVDVVGPADDPLLLLRDDGAMETVRSELRWMLRLVDAPAAVAARGWNPTVRGRVDLSLGDDRAPWNAGRWVLEIDEGRGRLIPGGHGTVELSVGALSSWWAGYTGARTLAATGHVRSSDPGALAVFDGLGAASPPTLVDFY